MVVLAAAGLMAILAISLVFVGPLVVGPEGPVSVVVGEALTQQAAPISNALSALDQSVTMLFSVTIGLAAIVGVLIRDAAASEKSMPWWITTAIAAFVGLTVWSCYLAYASRLRALRMTTLSRYPDPRLEELVGTLGMFVTLSGCVAIIVFAACYHSGLLKKGTEE